MAGREVQVVAYCCLQAETEVQTAGPREVPMGQATGQATGKPVAVFVSSDKVGVPVARGLVSMPARVVVLVLVWVAGLVWVHALELDLVPGTGHSAAGRSSAAAYVVASPLRPRLILAGAAVALVVVA